MEKTRILVVDDEIYIQEILRSTLIEAGHECIAAGSPEQTLEHLNHQLFDLAFVSTCLPAQEPAALIKDLHTSFPDLIIVAMMPADSTAGLVQTIRAGAFDCMVKPFQLEEALDVTARGIEKRRVDSAAREYQKYLEHLAEERAVETRRLFYATIQVLIRLLELKIPFNAGHAARVAEMCRYVAREVKMTVDGVRKVYLAALLHDVGLFVVTDLLLNKEDVLTAEEFRQMRAHASAAEDVLKPILADDEVLKYIRHHHERYDGTGYPDSLKGNIIPLGARIIAVVEAFEAMTRDRPYRHAFTPEEALAELKRCADSQFDPQVVSVFTELHANVFRNLDKAPLGKM
jgi:response regulator RpfG family c-di-GMP phosphodiesterase